MSNVRAVRHKCSTTALLTLTGVGLLWATVGVFGAGQAGLAADVERSLVGAIDIHVHSLPDDRPRSIDAVDVAKLASSRQMRAIVLKNHYESTAGLVYMVRKLVPGIEVFGGIDLNLTVGGINPSAVEHMTRVTGGWGRIVWMPTFDAENQVRYSKENRPFVSVSGKGDLLPAVKQVIALIAKHGLVLATGHSAPGEGLMLLREGRRQGVQRMVVTHAINAPVLMSVPQMQEAATLGAFIEFVGSSMTTADAQARVDRMADAIRKVGPEFCILSSDLGQQGNPLPPDGFGAFLVAMRARGFTEQEIARMSKQNPAQLLGLR
jgi:threonine dehydrogenase-like Zn-dependent dehydrogenase